MSRLLTVADICERYQCKEKTARRYMRQMEHMERPLRVTEKALEAWEASRTYESASGNRTRQTGRRAANKVYVISRVRPEVIG